jgi:N-acetylmuramoyl-L-alanine amidase
LAYGSSVFALSEKGSNNALARAMEDQNNKSDLIGGVDLPKMQTDVQKTVIDLALDKKIEHSLLLGEDILHELERVGRVHSRQVVQTGFMVLRSKFEVQMPSVLVETAFISTPEEEKKLRSTEYQQQLAAAILKGAKKYLVRNDYSPLAPTQVVVSDTLRVASRVSSDTPREHVVKLGDTLASIARHYNVNVDALRFLNQLTSDELQVGSRLLLPRVTQGS